MKTLKSLLILALSCLAPASASRSLGGFFFAEKAGGLLNRWAGVNVQYQFGMKMSHCNPWNNFLNEAKKSIGNGVNSNMARHNTTINLVDAAKKNHVEEVKRFLDARTSVDMVDEDGMTALMRAAINGNAYAVQMLIDAGADVNAVDGSGVTVLMYAARQGDAQAIQAQAQK